MRHLGKIYEAIRCFSIEAPPYTEYIVLLKHLICHLCIQNDQICIGCSNTGNKSNTTTNDTISCTMSDGTEDFKYSITGDNMDVTNTDGAIIHYTGVK